MYDVAIIGAGITGAAIARELSRFRINTAVVEKEADVGSGVSKANTGIIHAGVTARPGSLMAGLNIAGARLYEKLSKELHVPYRRTGAFIVAFGPEEMGRLRDYLAYGKQAGIPGLEILTRESALEKEPLLNPAITAALDVPGTAVINPYQMVIALAENAFENGVHFFTGFEIREIRHENGVFSLFSRQSHIEANFVVNAAGLFADDIARMIGDHSFTITPRKGEYFVLDRSEGTLTQRVIYPVPTPRTKGILITPAVEGNTLLGPNATEIKDKKDFSTTKQGLAEVWEGVNRLVPGIPAGKIIAQYAGLRPAAGEHDFVINWSESNPRFLNVAGIESPGLTAAPAIAELVRDKLSDAGLELRENKDFVPGRSPHPFLNRCSEHEQEELWKKNHDYGEIVCRCELVSRAEIIAALKSPFGGHTLDAVKRRTRAGQGRCQGGFCTPRLLEIIGEITGKSWDEFTKKGNGSWMLIKKKEEK